MSHYYQVNAKVHGKSALHIAIAEGYIHVLKTLLQYRPNLDIEVCVSLSIGMRVFEQYLCCYIFILCFYLLQDETGERPLHFCAHLYVILPPIYN